MTRKIRVRKVKNEEPKKNENGVFVACMGSQAAKKSFQILGALRDNGLTADGTINNQSLKSQMRLANSLAMRHCIIIGEDELKENVVTLKDLKNQSQQKVPMDKIVDFLKNESKK